MLIELMSGIADDLRKIDELNGAKIEIALVPRFDPAPEGQLNIIIAPSEVRIEKDARDIVKEVTTIGVSMYMYFANEFELDDRSSLLNIAPAVQRAMLARDYVVNGGVYRWNGSYSAGEPYNNTRKTVYGGLYDIAAADNAYVFQVPIYLEFSRFLQMR